MNIISFLRLFRAIHSSNKPDIKMIEKQGLLSVKIAQHYALRIDFLKREVCAELSKLFRNTSKTPPADVDKLLSENCPDGWINNFSRFDREAFASASVGQVHRGTLLNGDKVVVKLIKKQNQEQFISDINKARKYINFVIFFYRKLKRVFNPIDVIDYIEEYTLSELNLKNEISGAEYLQHIKETNCELYDFSKLRLPKYYETLSNENVLVSELILGESFDELLNKKELPYDTLLDFFKIHGFYLFVAGRFHGDIHPGNIILDNNGMITLIDNGAISEVDDKTRKGLFSFFISLCEHDYKNASKAIYAISSTSISESSLNNFECEFLELYKDFKDSTVSEISLTKKMMQTIKLAVNHGMSFGDDMFGIIKGLMYLDGMVLRCNPDAILMEDIKKFAKGVSDLV